VKYNHTPSSDAVKEGRTPRAVRLKRQLSDDIGFYDLDPPEIAPSMSSQLESEQDYFNFINEISQSDDILSQFEMTQNESSIIEGEETCIKEAIKRLHTRREFPDFSLFRTASLDEVTEEKESSVKEPTLAVEYCRWPGWLRNYGSVKTEETVVRIPLEMIKDRPSLYIELSLPEFVENWIDDHSNSFDDDTIKSISRKSRSFLTHKIEAGPKDDFDPLRDEQLIRVPLSNGIAELDRWEIKIVPHGPRRRLKLESSRLTIVINRSAQTDPESAEYFDLILESLLLWKAIQWDLTLLPFINAVMNYFKENNDAKKNFTVLVVKLLHQNLQKAVGEFKPGRGATSLSIREHKKFLHRISDPQNTMGPIFSVLEWLWIESGMEYGAEISSSKERTEGRSLSAILERELIERTTFPMDKWINSTMSSARMIVESITLTVFRKMRYHLLVATNYMMTLLRTSWVDPYRETFLPRSTFPKCRPNYE